MAFLLAVVLVCANDAGVSSGSSAGWCDELELNHVTEGQFTAGVTQLLFWRLDKETGQYHVADFMMVSEDFQLPHQSPLIVRQQGKIVAIRFTTSIETTTDYDPEIWDRAVVPVDKRTGVYHRRLVSRLRGQQQQQGPRS